MAITKSELWHTKSQSQEKEDLWDINLPQNVRANVMLKVLCQETFQLNLSLFLLNAKTVLVINAV